VNHTFFLPIWFLFPPPPFLAAAYLKISNVRETSLH
jgi:hypothetical protein